MHPKQKNPPFIKKVLTTYRSQDFVQVVFGICNIRYTIRSFGM